MTQGDKEHAAAPLRAAITVGMQVPVEVVIVRTALVERIDGGQATLAYHDYAGAVQRLVRPVAELKLP